jgi:hypothetical protein
MPKNAVCAEVGVWKGKFSKRIIRNTSPNKLHLIDPWSFQPDFPMRKFGGKHARTQEDMDRIFEGVQRRFRRIPAVSIHRRCSEEALGEFRDGYLDWIYLDGNHAFEFITKDLELSFSKVRSGGFISGDDYTWGRKTGFPVEKAVRKFVEEKNLRDHIEILGSQFIIERP